MQVKDAAFYDNVSGTDFANYQLWLYESSNIVELHYGPNSVLDPSSWQVPNATGPGVAIGIDAGSIMILNGPAASPTAYTSSSTLTIDGAPANGQVYTFTPAATSVNELSSEKSFTIFPNPNNGSFKIDTRGIVNADLSIYDVSGRKVYHTALFEKIPTIDTELSKGMYVSELRNGDKVSRVSFVVE